MRDGRILGRCSFIGAVALALAATGLATLPALGARCTGSTPNGVRTPAGCDPSKMWGTENVARLLENPAPQSKNKTAILWDIVQSIGIDEMGIPPRRIVDLFAVHAAGNSDDIGAIAVWNDNPIPPNRRRTVYYGKGIDDRFSGPGHNYGFYAVFAHELAHHLYGHAESKLPGDRLELDADYFAGCVIGIMAIREVNQQNNIPVRKHAVDLYELAAPVPGAGEHPERARRLKYFDAGYNVGANAASDDILRCMKPRPKID